VTEADLLFAAAVLESMSWALEPDARLAAARREIADRYQVLKSGLSFTDASRLARAEWLGAFLVRQGGGDEKPPPVSVPGGGSSRTAQSLSATGAVSPPAGS
jgi:hypothetical protein